MELIQEFKNYLLSQKKQPSKATVKNYVADVKKFISWYETTSSQKFSPLGVSLHTIEEYKKTHIKEFSASSIDRHLSSLKKFFYFLKLEGKVAINPFDQVRIEPAKVDLLHLKEFKDFLYVYNASHLTIKNYLIDIKQFFTWLKETISQDPQKEDSNLLPLITDEIIKEYTNRLYHTQTFSPASINRKLSSLRKYLSWAHEQGYLAPGLTTLPANIPSSLLNEAVKTVKTKNNTNNEATTTANSEGMTRVDNAPNESSFAGQEQNEWQGSEYLLDILTETQTTKEEIQEEEPTYSKIPPVRLTQKIVGLLSLIFEYTVIIPTAHITTFVQHKIWILQGKPLFSKKATKALPVLQQNLKRLHIKNLPKSLYNPLGLSIAHYPWHKKVLYHIQYTRPQWYKNYSRLAAAKYFNMAILIIFCAMIGFGMYSTFFSGARKSPSLAASPGVAPPRVLSFQGRLTDNNDNPITANTNLRFAIYNSSSASGSALLWQEVDPVSPDTDGDFSTLLGNNTTIPQSIFAQNNALWLGVTVETTPELTPRQQIATVAYATNAEVLQGMPPITQVGAGTQNVILALDSGGNLAVGASTTFQSTSGTFTLSGNTLALTTNTSSNGNITISPDGSGTIDMQKVIQNSTLNNNIPSAAGAVEVDDLLAVLATSSGQSAFTLNQNGTGPLISASTSGTAKFTVDNSGDVFAAGNVTGQRLYTGGGTTYYIDPTTSNLNSLTLAADLAVSGNVGSNLVPSASDTYSLGSDPTAAGREWLNLYVKNLFLNGQALTQLFQRNAGVVSPINITDDFAVGGTSTASAKFHVYGTTSGSIPAGTASTSGYLSFTNSNAQVNLLNGGTLGFYNSPGGDSGTTGPSLFINNNGTVGINTTSTLAKLDVRGSLSSTPVASLSGNTTVPTLLVDNSGSGSIISARANGAEVFKVDNAGIAYAGQFIDFNNTAYFLDPAATGTSLKVAGGIGAGGASPSTFTIQSAGSVGPNANNTYDLGSFSSNLQWRNIYGQHIFSNGVEVTQLWQENLGALSPLHITDDFLLGATATPSARFAVTNIAGGIPTASLSAGLNSGTYITADGTLATRALQTLTLGSTSTGNINLGSDATGRTIAIGNTTGATGLTLRVGTGNFSLDGVAGSTYAIGASTVGGTITLGGTSETGTLTLGQSTAGQSINIGNAVNSSSQQIQIANGASAANSEVDILSGAGTAGTSTLKLGDNSRVGTIDIGNIAANVTRVTTIAGGNAANDDTVNILTGNPSVGTQTVNILTGSATGGSQALNLGTGTSAKTITIGGSGNNTITIGNTQNGGSLSLGNALTSGTISIGGTGIQTGSITIGDGTGNQTIDLGNGSGNKTISIGGTGTANTINIGNNQTAGKINIGIASSLTTIMGSNFTTGGVAYATGSAMFFTSAGSAGQCLLSNGTSAPGWGLCTFGNGNYWNLQNGALFPNNSTVDFLVGGSATNSAKFGVLGIAGGTPTASVSSGLNGTAMSMDANGNLQTANKMTLTIGGSTTGNIVLSPRNGSSGTITFAGYATGIIHSANGLLSSSAVDLQNDITNTLQVTHGGTGLASLASGSLIYGGGGATATALPIGSTNSLLTSLNGVPTWSPYATLSALFVNNNTQLNTISSATNTIDPTTNGTLNLGDGTHYFGTIYANNIVIPVGNGTSGFWQLSSNVISPVNNFYDLAVGGSATGSATPFQVFGTTVGVNTAGTASSSGNLAFRGSNTEIDLLNSTGLNIKSSVGGNAGLASVFNLTNAGNVTIAGTLAVNGNTISTGTTSTFTLLNTTINTLNFAQGTTNLTIGTGGGTTTTINGNITLGDNTSLRLLTVNAKINSDLLANSDNSHDLGATGDYWRNIYANNLFANAITGTSGYWQVNTNVISPAFNWQDLGIGGTATASASFQIFANSYANDLGTVLAGTASSSGNLTFKGGSTQVNLLKNSTLGFYNSVGGDKGITLTNPELYLNNNGRIAIGTTNPLATLDIRGNSTTIPTASISGQTSAAGLVISNTGTGDYIDINNGGKNIAAFIQNGSLSHNAFVPGSTDSYDLGSNPSSGGKEWDTLYVRQVITPSGSLGSNYWQLTNSVIAPATLTNDLAIGGAATSSATFQVFGTSYTNDLGTVPSGTASTSGNLTFRGTPGSSTAFRTNILNGASLGFYTSVGGDKGITTSIPSLFLAANGNVGIGTSNPTAPLQIGTDSNTIPGLLIGGGTNTQNFLSLSGGRAMFGYDTNFATLQSGVGHGLAFQVATTPFGSTATTSAEITREGFFGIGTGNSITTVGNAQLVVNQTNSYGLGDIFTASASGTTKFVINNNGDVAIGPSLTTAQGILDVASNATNLPSDLTLAQTTGTNLLPNPSFEGNSTTNWALSQGGTGGTIAATTSASMFGRYSLLVTTGTSWTAADDTLTVTPNTTYTLSAWVKTSSSLNAHLQIFDHGTSIGTVSSYHPGDGNWHRLTVTATTGASTTSIDADIVTGTTASTTLVDGFQLEQASSASPYIDGSLGPGYYWTGTPNNSTSVRQTGTAFAYNTLNSASGIGAASQGLFPTLQLDQDGSGDVISASASGTNVFKVSNMGVITANSLFDSQNTTYFLDPANTGISLNVAGGGMFGNAAATLSGELVVRNTTNDASVKDGLLVTDNTMSGAMFADYMSTYAGNPPFAQIGGWNYMTSSWANTVIPGGSVGIGTYNPGNKLSVNANSSAYGELQVGNTTSNGEASIGFISGVTAYGSSPTSTNGNANIWTEGVGSFSAGNGNFGIGNASHGFIMGLTSGGNVGIGTTNPNAKLTIANNVASGFLNTYAQYQEILFDNGTAAGSYGFGIKNNTMVFNSGAGAYSFDRGASATTLYMDTGGNVGIGTTSPTAKLDIAGTTMRFGIGTQVFTNPTLSTDTSDELQLSQVANGSNTDWRLNFEDDAADTFSFYGGSCAISCNNLNDSKQIMTLTGGGNVGIGTTSPLNVFQIAKDETSMGSVENNTQLILSGATNPAAQLRLGYDTGANTATIQATHWGSSSDTLFLNPSPGKVVVGTTVASGKEFTVGGAPCSVLGANSCIDYAEYYNSSEIASAGDIVSLDEASSSGKLVKLSTSSYDQTAIGVVSTNPAITIEEGKIGFGGDASGQLTQPSLKPPVALAGRVPVKVSTINGPIHVGDMITTSSIKGMGMKATKAGPVVGKAMEDFDPSQYKIPDGDGQITGSIPCPTDVANNISCAKIFVYVNTSWYDPNALLTNLNGFSLNLGLDQLYHLLDPTGQQVSRVNAFAQAIIANLQVGMLNVQSIATNSLAIATDNVSIAGQSLHDYIVSVVNQVLQNTQSSGTTSPIADIDQIHTNLISPLASDSAIMLDLNNSRIAVKNSATGNTVASIDNAGNATFSGTLTSQNLAVNGDATVSGTLHADKIEANSIVGLSAMVSTLSAQNVTSVTNIYFATPSATPIGENSATGSGTTGNNNYGLLTQSNGFADIASFSAYLSYIPNLKAVTGMFQEGLISLGPTTLTDTSVNGTLSIGSQMMLADNSINVLGADLQLQPLKQGGIAFVGGQVRIDTDGNLTVNGKAMFQNTLYASTISPLAGQDLTIQLGDATSSTSANPTPQLSIKNASGSGIFAINQLGDIVASGAANIAKLNFNFVQPAMAISDTEVVATSSAGTAAIKAYQTQLTIDDSQVTANSLIYITPVGNQAATPYLMRQVPGTSFTVGISVPSSKDVNFNWLIVN